MNDAEHCPELRGCGPLGACLYWIEGCLERGAETHRELQQEEGDDGADKVGLRGTL